MSILTYFEREGAMNRSRLAEAIGISKGRMTQLCEPGVDWPPQLAMKAEAATGGIIDASDLSPVVAEARRTAA